MASRPGLGTTFSIYLPAVEGTAEGLPPKLLSKPVAGNETILLVEDEDPVREVTALLLESLGYQVLQVSNAEDALNLLENTRAKIDLLFTDVIMPGMSGRELAEAFRARDPGIKVLFQSGYTDDMVQVGAHEAGRCMPRPSKTSRRIPSLLSVCVKVESSKNDPSHQRATKNTGGRRWKNANTNDLTSEAPTEFLQVTLVLDAWSRDRLFPYPASPTLW